MKMPSTAQRVRTSIVLGAAGATLIATLLLHARPTPPPSADDRADDGMQLSARLPSGRIPTGAHEANIGISITAPTQQREGRPPVSVAIVIDRSPSMADVASESNRPS